MAIGVPTLIPFETLRCGSMGLMKTTSSINNSASSSNRYNNLEKMNRRELTSATRTLLRNERELAELRQSIAAKDIPPQWENNRDAWKLVTNRWVQDAESRVANAKRRLEIVKADNEI